MKEGMVRVPRFINPRGEFDVDLWFMVLDHGARYLRILTDAVIFGHIYTLL